MSPVTRSQTRSQSTRSVLSVTPQIVEDGTLQTVATEPQTVVHSGLSLTHFSYDYWRKNKPEGLYYYRCEVIYKSMLPDDKKRFGLEDIDETTISKVLQNKFCILSYIEKNEGDIYVLWNNTAYNPKVLGENHPVVQQYTKNRVILIKDPLAVLNTFLYWDTLKCIVRKGRSAYQVSIVKYNKGFGTWFNKFSLV